MKPSWPASQSVPRFLSLAGALAVIAGALFFFGKEPADSADGSTRLGGFVSWDSGLYPGRPQSWPQWLDDDTIVFAGDALGKPGTLSEASDRTDAIIVWHLGDSPIPYRDERWLKMGNGRIVCAANGVLAYSVGYDTASDGTRLLKIEEGPPGQTKERIVDYPEQRPRQGLYPFAEDDSAPCDFYRDPKMNGRHWTVDHDRKFYLDFGPFEQWPPTDDPVTLLSPTVDKAPVVLPVTRKQAIFACTQYHAFSGLFYLQDCGNWEGKSFEKATCRVYWTVNPSTAQTERHCVPFDPVLGEGWDQLLPTARGIFFSTSQNMTMSDVGLSGLFWSRGKTTSLVVKGFVQNVSVSPNGCRLAFSYAKALRDIVVGTWGKYSIVAIDVCQER